MIFPKIFFELFISDIYLIGVKSLTLLRNFNSFQNHQFNLGDPVLRLPEEIMSNSDIQINNESESDSQSAKMCCKTKKISYLNWKVFKEFIQLNKFIFPSWRSGKFF